MKKRILTIITAFSISFIIMIALSVISMNRFITYAYYSNFSDTSGIIIDNIYQAELHLRDIDRAERGYMITRDTMFRRYVYNAIDSMKNDIIDIDLLIDDNPLQQHYIELLKDTMGLKIGAVVTNVNFVDTTNSENTLSRHFYESRGYMLACNRLLKKIHGLENKRREERQNSEHIYETLTTNTLSYLLVIFCIVTLVLFALMIKELRGRIKFQEQLQAKIVDLKRSHVELEEIAYAASHDLQEPLRKIQVFSNMLLVQQTDDMTVANRESLKRINTLANRMQLLISDLFSLTSLTKIDEVKKEVDLNKVINFLTIDMEEKIMEKNALIVVDSLPNISGYENQLKLLFNALFDNALKFTRYNVQPVVRISGSMVTGAELKEVNPNLKNRKYHQISFSDNGIGFDNVYMNKMFRLFQRLHTQNSEYVGKGIGLAICQRVVTNHEGYVVADGRRDEGATFKLYFPAD